MKRRNKPDKDKPTYGRSRLMPLGITAAVLAAGAGVYVAMSDGRPKQEVPAAQATIDDRIHYLDASKNPELRQAYVDKLERWHPFPDYISKAVYIDDSFKCGGTKLKFSIVPPRALESGTVQFDGPFTLEIGRNFFGHPKLQSDDDALQVIFGHEIYGHGASLAEWRFPATPHELADSNGVYASKIFRAIGELEAYGNELDHPEPGVSETLMNNALLEYIGNYSFLYMPERDAEIVDKTVLPRLREHYFRRQMVTAMESLPEFDYTSPLMIEDDTAMMSPLGYIRLPDTVVSKARELRDELNLK